MEEYELYFGDEKIDELYWGKDEIDELWCGDTLFWKKNSYSYTERATEYNVLYTTKMFSLVKRLGSEYNGQYDIGYRDAKYPGYFLQSMSFKEREYPTTFSYIYANELYLIDAHTWLHYISIPAVYTIEFAYDYVIVGQVYPLQSAGKTYRKTISLESNQLPKDCNHTVIRAAYAFGANVYVVMDCEKAEFSKFDPESNEYHVLSSVKLGQIMLEITMGDKQLTYELKSCDIQIPRNEAYWIRGENIYVNGVAHNYERGTDYCYRCTKSSIDKFQTGYISTGLGIINKDAETVYIFTDKEPKPGIYILNASDGTYQKICTLPMEIVLGNKNATFGAQGINSDKKLDGRLFVFGKSGDMWKVLYLGTLQNLTCQTVYEGTEEIQDIWIQENKLSVFISGFERILTL